MFPSIELNKSIGPNIIRGHCFDHCFFSNVFNRIIRLGGGMCAMSRADGRLSILHSPPPLLLYQSIHLATVRRFFQVQMEIVDWEGKAIGVYWPSEEIGKNGVRLKYSLVILVLN